MKGEETKKAKGAANHEASIGVVGKPTRYKVSKIFSDPRGWPIIGVLVLVVVAVIIAVLLRGSAVDNSPVVLSVSGFGTTHEVTQKEYESILEQAKQQNVAADVAKETIIRAYQYQITAPRLGLEPTEADIVEAAEAGAGYGGEGPLDDWQELYGYAAGVDSALLLTKQGGYVGALFDYPYYFSNPDSKVAEADRQYAEKKAAQHHRELTDGKASAQAIIARILKDDRLVAYGYGSDSRHFRMDMNGAMYIDGDDVIENLPPYVVEAVKALGDKPAVSGVQEIRGDDWPDAKGYFFVSVTNIIPAKQSIENDLKEMNNAVKVVDNVR